jgi:hypothetical protein
MRFLWGAASTLHGHSVPKRIRGALSDSEAFCDLASRHRLNFQLTVCPDALE